MLGYVGYGKVVKEKERRNGQLNLSKNTIKKIRNSVLTVLFFCFLGYYFVQNNFYSPTVFFAAYRESFSSKQSFFENDRNVKQAILKEEDRYNEAFFDRQKFLDQYGTIQKKLHRHVVDDADRARTVFVGQEDMLYYVVDSPVEVDSFVDSFEQLNEFLTSKDVPFVYVQCPYKHLKNSTVFPVGVADYGNQTADEFVNRLREKQISVLDLNTLAVQGNGDTVLREQKDFFKTDTHWRIPTAFWGYQQIVKFLEQKDVALENVSLSTNREQYNEKKWEKAYLGSHAKRVGTAFYDKKDDVSVLLPKFDTSLSYTKWNREGKQIKKREGTFEESFLFYGYITEEDIFQDKYIVFMDWGASEDWIQNRNVKNGTKVLVIKDSFAMPIAGFLSLNVSELRMLDIRKENRPQSIKKYVEEYQPDVVLFVASPTSMYYSPEMFEMKETIEDLKQ